jgi:hypothetical protein
MNRRKRAVAVIGAAALALTIAGPAFADDGYLVRKSMSHEGSAKLPPGQTMQFPVENEHAFINSMKFYVPMQQSDGTTLDTAVDDSDLGDYYNVDGEFVEQRTAAKPLIGVYINGQVEEVEDTGFTGHGIRDAWGAVSLDDGVTWKNTNLSESSDLSSSDVVRKDIKLFKDTKYAYPGDVTNIVHAVAGDKVMVAWPSRFCSQGEPNYSLDADTEESQLRRAAIAEYLGIDLETASYDDLYLVDMYRVAGQQGSVDYADDKWEQNQPVGEVPYSCVWTARGQLVGDNPDTEEVEGDDPRTEAVEKSYMRWFNTERLTSGRRDANRLEIAGVEGAGFVLTWQEDPDGLRPGQGEGPGEGWSGAIANSGTDIWYSYLDWENFDVVQDPDDPTGETPIGLVNPITVAGFETQETYEADRATVDGTTQKPKPFVPMSMPMPITDNAKCNVTNPAPYCWGSALQGDVEQPTDSSGNPLDPLAFEMKDMCVATVAIPTGPEGTPSDVCITEDGLPLIGNTASTRARVNLFGYQEGEKAVSTGFDSAFVVVQVEEDKGLGRATYVDSEPDGLPDGIEDGSMTTCEPQEGDNTCIAWDTGKNQRYHSFSMSLTDDLALDERDGLVDNLTFAGHLLNQPEVNWTTGDFNAPLPAEAVWNGLEAAGYSFDIWNTEIARRGSLLAQDIYKAEDSKSGLLVLPTWKQGLMNQGGPADVMSRRIVAPKNWDPAKDGNPYAFAYLTCDDLVDDGNPFYPGGVCMDPAINASGTIPGAAVDSSDESETPTTFLAPYAGDYGDTLMDGDTVVVNPILNGLVPQEGDTTKVLTWYQAPYAATTVASDELPEPTREFTEGEDTTDDQSWFNPYDVAKGHRGFLDGDFVMMLYAWSPNWRLNAVGRDRYELYIRRSFDGAESFTTLPKNFEASDDEKYDGDGTVTCETYRDATTQNEGDSDEPRVCYSYDEDAYEQARNVTQHKSMRTTTLDPRYTPTAASITADPFGTGYAFTEEDTRDPSRYFVVYETGDNTTTAFGEAEPMDLFYSRAVNFGDDYVVWDEAAEDGVEPTQTESECYPSVSHDDPNIAEDDPRLDSGFCNEFDQMEQGTPGLEASEASLTANPGGEFLYGAWAQFLVEEKNKNYNTVESDAMARRVWFIDDYISETEAWSLPGTNQE